MGDWNSYFVFLTLYSKITFHWEIKKFDAFVILSWADKYQYKCMHFMEWFLLVHASLWLLFQFEAYSLEKMGRNSKEAAKLLEGL